MESPVALPEPHQHIVAGSVAVLSGWGKLSMVSKLISHFTNYNASTPHSNIFALFIDGPAVCTYMNTLKKQNELLTKSQPF